MRLHARHLYRFMLTGSALVALSCAPSGAWAQQNGNSDQEQVQIEGFSRADLATFDEFLDANPEIARSLRANPSLVSDSTYLDEHTQLKEFLNNHATLRQKVAVNPSRFIDAESRYETTKQDRMGDNRPGRNPNPDLTRGEVASMDQFLDSHQDIEKQLQANPSLIKNQDFLRDHPQLQDFLNDHPRVQAEFAETPQVFMNRENRYENSPADQRADNGNPNRNPNPDLTRGEVASMDQFLDSHQDIEKQLQANPSLINDSKYLKDHGALRAFLSSHPEVREEFTENPSSFIHREGQFERTEESPRDVATMDAYLDKHPDIARDLEAYPARVNDSDYLSHHKDLESFLKKHPEVRSEFTENPSSFMRQESTFEASAEMDDFLGNHKKIGKDLDENPERVKDNDYLDHHKDLKNFLAKNPGVSDRFEDNPRDFMDRERRFDADRDMDMYLSKHQNVAKDLQKDPDRMKDDKYLDHHKDLKEVLDKHPDLGQMARANPAQFMHEQIKFHQDYKSQHIQHKTKVEQRASVHGAQ